MLEERQRKKEKQSHIGRKRDIHIHTDIITQSVSKVFHPVRQLDW